MERSADIPRNQNTYVLDPESAAEMARLISQDHLVTEYMGGLLAERPNFSYMHRVLDIACGPGGWAQEVAFAHPKIEVVGIDISKTMIEYANAQAEVQNLTNLEFLVMDVHSPLEFPDESFDLVNARFLIGFMPPAAWPKLIAECWRITRPGGAIRLTETDDMGNTSSPAFEKLWKMCSLAFFKAGRSFSPTARNFGINPKLRYFLHQAGYQDIRTTGYAIDFSTGADAHRGVYQDWKIGLKLLQPFLIKMEVTKQEEAESLYQAAMTEMLAEDFCALWYLLSAWGIKPER